MSRLDELIAELCPDGVEYKTLGEIGTFIRGSGLQKKDFTESGVGCIHYGQIYTFYGSFAYKTKTFVSEELAKTLKVVTRGDLIFAITSENIEDVCKCLAWLGEDDIVIGGYSAIFKHNQNPKYITYYTQTEDFFRQKRRVVTGTKVIEAAPSKLSLIKIPVPPLPVQEEIVRILDKFTELTAELTAELAKRKQQYQYYRNILVNFKEEIDKPSKINELIAELCPNGIKFEKLEDNCLLLDSERRPVTKKDRTAGIYPYYGANGIQDYVDEYIFEGTFLLMGEDGSVINPDGSPILNWATGKIWVNNHAHILSEKKGTSLRYLYYVLQTVNISSVVRGTPPKLNQKNLNNIIIPVPPLPIQEEIVRILDRFDALCNDLTSGLPAEIEARKKQYEYYRDKLLTFKEAV